jgi:signal peptidase II
MRTSTHPSFGDSFRARMMPKSKVFLGSLAIALPLDQLAKLAVVHWLTFADRIAVIDGFFYLTHVRNPGSAFGLFASSPEPYRSIFFIGITGVAILMIFSFYRRLAPGDRLSALALGLVLGGAAGNLIDRIRLGEVVDFLHFRLWGGYTWPDFNLADSFIVAGVALLVLELLATEGERRAQSAATGSQD